MKQTIRTVTGAINENVLTRTQEYNNTRNAYKTYVVVKSHYENAKKKFIIVMSTCVGWLGGVTVRASDLRSSGRGFDSRSGCCQSQLILPFLRDR